MPVAPRGNNGSTAFRRLGSVESGYTAARKSVSSRANQAQAGEDHAIESRRQPPAGEMDAGEACCRFGWANHWQTTPNAVSRQYAARHGPRVGVALSQR